MCDVAHDIDLSWLVVYLLDTIITFPDEVRSIWSRKWTVVTWVYLFIRYLGLMVSIVLAIPSNSGKVCLLHNLRVFNTDHAFSRGTWTLAAYRRRLTNAAVVC